MARILIVENEPTARAALARVVTSLGHDVIAVGSFGRAIAVLDAAPMDVVLTNYRLGVPDGLTLVRFATERWPSTRTIVMISDLDEAVALAAGAGACLHQPFSSLQLASAVHAVTSGHTAATAS
jgi:two-component system, NtrC family, response regulator AtoC